MAELLLQADHLTINVRAVPLERVLLDLSRQDAFEVTILEEKAVRGHMVTEHFIQLPIEEGLDRILSNWNCSLAKNPKT